MPKSTKSIKRLLERFTSNRKLLDLAVQIEVPERSNEGCELDAWTYSLTLPVEWEGWIESSEAHVAASRVKFG